MRLTRRNLMRKTASVALAVGAAPLFAGAADSAPGATGANAGDDARGGPEGAITVRDFLKNVIYNKQELDDWFAGKAFTFARYDGYFGWLLNSRTYPDGIGESVCVYTYADNDGERLMGNYAEKPCRINTYGNSMTQCHQVSDHETWQEVLAAHLQEPVRNFGVGGWSVYQAYLRMLKEEERTPAPHIIFNIYDDDHRRNLDSWRNIRAHQRRNRDEKKRYIEPTLPYLKVNAATGTFVERPNPCPTKESFYQLCDLDRAVEMFQDDFVLRIMLAHRNARSKNPNLDYSEFAKMTTTHGVETQIESGATLSEAANALHERSALFASEQIVERIEDFARRNDKKVLYVLSYAAAAIARRVQTGTRWDQPFVDFLKEKGLPFVDLMEAHVAEFEQFKVGIREYTGKYFIGHYNPTGNHFCAFAMKDKVVDMLDPKPLPYRKG